MKCEEIRVLIPDYLSETLDQQVKSRIDEHTLSCADCRREIDALALVWSKMEGLSEEEPGPAIRTRFYTMLEAYKHGVENAPQRPSMFERLNERLRVWWPRQPVFQFCVTAIFLIVGLTIGLRVNTVSRSTGELERLNKEMTEMRQLVTLSLLNQPIASDRLRGVFMSRDIPEPDDRYLAALVTTLNSDPNVSVRLAAVDALQRFSDSSDVRTDLVASLPRQTSPLVQISLIDTLVRLREKRAVDAFKIIAENPRSIEPVKKRAKMGLDTIY
ncbi:MAG: HEAT repeat domain-containing protein [Deltaproteobacteria bacterium]|nr:HEAT repeat domain-containing protein [Deltaproteobacteria bacterium]